LCTRTGCSIRSFPGGRTQPAPHRRSRHAAVPWTSAREAASAAVRACAAGGGETPWRSCPGWCGELQEMLGRRVRQDPARGRGGASEVPSSVQGPRRVRRAPAAGAQGRGPWLWSGKGLTVKITVFLDQSKR
jgi:hypothetical protein